MNATPYIYALIRLYAIYLFISSLSYLPALAAFAEINGLEKTGYNLVYTSQIFGDLVYSLLSAIIAIFMWFYTGEFIKLISPKEAKLDVKIDLLKAGVTITGLYLAFADLNKLAVIFGDNEGYNLDAVSTVAVVMHYAPMVAGVLLVIFRNQVTEKLR